MKLALSMLAVSAVAFALPQSASTPPPSFKITNVVSGGTGCPQGTIDVKWTDDKVLPICEPFSHFSVDHPIASNLRPTTSYNHVALSNYFFLIPVIFQQSYWRPPDFGKEFVATVGPKADITDSRKFCQLNLELSYSAGYSFAVYNAEYAGFADLDPGVTGTIKSNYYFSGETDQVRRSQQ
jgi:hypothetical protein